MTSQLISRVRRGVAAMAAATAALLTAGCASVDPAAVDSGLAQLEAVEEAYPGGVETLSFTYGRARAGETPITRDDVQRMTEKTVALLRRGDGANIPAADLSGPVYGELSRAATALATTKATLAVCAQNPAQLRALTRFLAGADANARFAPPQTTPAKTRMLKRHLRSNFALSADARARGLAAAARASSGRSAPIEALIAVDPARRPLIPGRAPLRCAQLVAA